MPGIERMQRVDLRTITLDVPPQDVITRDNVSVKVNAVLYFRVVDPQPAVVEVRELPLRDVAAGADDAAQRLRPGRARRAAGRARRASTSSSRTILDDQTDPWGIKVVPVEVKHIDLPQEMQRAMARQAEAERERRAKIIKAEGEFQAADRLAEAAKVIEPAARQCSCAISRR